MPIKNYTSGVKPTTSIGLIQSILGEYGASKISIDYDDGKVSALEFKMNVKGMLVAFRLTVDVEAMLKAMKNDPKVPAANCTYAQAERTAWKNKYEWLHIQLAEVESGQAKVEELLLGYAITETGKTFFEQLVDDGVKKLQAAT